MLEIEQSEETMFQFKKKPVPEAQESLVASALFDGPRTGFGDGDGWRALWECANESSNESAWDAFLAGDDAKSESDWLLKT